MCKLGVGRLVPRLQRSVIMAELVEWRRWNCGQDSAHGDGVGFVLREAGRMLGSWVVGEMYDSVG